MANRVSNNFPGHPQKKRSLEGEMQREDHAHNTAMAFIRASPTRLAAWERQQEKIKAREAVAEARRGWKKARTSWKKRQRG
jgi:hypothetical protein